MTSAGIRKISRRIFRFRRRTTPPDFLSGFLLTLPMLSG
jgi:hypothetical protein